MSADSQVMEHFPSTLSRAESDDVAARIRRHVDEHGFGFWAVEVPGVTSFAGFAGLAHSRFDSHFTPCVEIGWRLAQTYWNQGYATEAARAALKFGFIELGLPEIVSFTVPANRASRRVMEKLDMERDPDDDFEHPLLPDSHRLRRHVLYRMTRDAWLANRK
jgi:RimJ/RimL family protein N-acetyltransferase